MTTPLEQHALPRGFRFAAGTAGIPIEMLLRAASMSVFSSEISAARAFFFWISTTARSSW